MWPFSKEAKLKKRVKELELEVKSLDYLIDELESENFNLNVMLDKKQKDLTELHINAYVQVNVNEQTKIDE